LPTGYQSFVYFRLNNRMTAIFALARLPESAFSYVLEAKKYRTHTHATSKAILRFSGFPQP
jgi:hypothetical protein